MSIIVTTRSEITVRETIALGPGASDSTNDTGINTTQLKLGATSTPPVSLKSHFAQALVSGAATIDLLALIGSQGQTLASTGLRVQEIPLTPPRVLELLLEKNAALDFPHIAKSWRDNVLPGSS